MRRRRRRSLPEACTPSRDLRVRGTAAAVAAGSTRGRQDAIAEAHTGPGMARLPTAPTVGFRPA